MALYGSSSLLQVIFVSVLLGGGAAWLTGRAVAETWRPFWHTIAYIALLGAAVRYVHFALFEGPLLSFAPYAADTVFLLIVGSLSWRTARAAQMVRQYPWLYERKGLLAWRLRPNAAVGTDETGAFSG